MLPMEKAIGCCLELSDSYMISFKDIPDPRATISAGLVFSQYRVPLSVVLHEAHDLLDDVAKDQNGRGSLAVSVLKPSGKHCQWTATWDCLKVPVGKNLLDDLVPALKGDRQFSTRFFYSIREIFTALSGDLSEKPGSYVHLAEGMDPVGLLAAEYMMSMEWTENPVSRKEAEDRMKSLLRLCYRSRRDKDGKAMLPEKNCLSTDGVMLLKFLSQSGEGVE
jgi:CRISPR-associated protein Cmr2